MRHRRRTWRRGCPAAEAVRGQRTGFESLEPRRVLAAGAVAIDPGWFAAVDSMAAVSSMSVAGARQEWLVQLTPEATRGLGGPVEADRALAAALPGVRVLRGLGGSGQLLVSAPEAGLAAESLAALPVVALVEPNGLVTAAASEPDDPRFQDGSLWGLSNRGLYGGLAGADIDAPAAWEVTTGEADMVVAIIDGGVDISHPDLSPNVWRNPGEIPGNGIDDDGNGFIDDVHGWDFRDRDASVFDAGDNNHGTQVAGIIAARGNNGLGVVGVSWNSQIMPLKFIGSGGGSTADAITALNYMTMMRQRGVNLRVANLSWGSGDSSWLLERAIAAAGGAGILVVASAGNAGVNQDTAWSPNYPSSFSSANILAVAATDNRDRLVSDSNYGLTRVDLGAPGFGILSTVPGRTYAANSGTSFAAPFVSGVAALAVSVNPDLSVGELRQVILAGVETVPSLAGKVATGGRLNAARTLAAVIDQDPSYAGREYLTPPAGETLVDDRVRQGPRQLVIRGPGLVVLEGANVHTGGTRVESGTLVLREPRGLGAGPVEVLDGARLVLDIGFTTATVRALARSATGVIDLGTGGIVVAAGGSDETAIREGIRAGRVPGSVSGIQSSAVSDASRSIGYSVAADGEARLVFTAPGDLDLDRDVDVLDLVAMVAAARFGTGVPAGWSEGDIDYDGLANVFDLVAIAAGGGYGIGSLLPGMEVIAPAGSQPGAVALLSGGTGGERDLDLVGRRRGVGTGGLSRARIELRGIDAGAGLEISRECESLAVGSFQFQVRHPPLPAGLLALDHGHGGGLRTSHVEFELGDAVGLVGRAADAPPAADGLTDGLRNPRVRFELLHRFDHERMVCEPAAADSSQADDEDNQQRES